MEISFAVKQLVPQINSGGKLVHDNYLASPGLIAQKRSIFEVQDLTFDA